jgi:hypothetical protein
MLRIYAKVDTCDWTGTFYAQVIGAHLSPRGSDIKEVRVYSDFMWKDPFQAESQSV